MTQHTSPVGLVQVHPLDDNTITELDIIAVHGLDTKSPDTWVWRANKHDTQDVNWLAHPDMLPKIAPRARIFHHDWPANLLQQSISTPTSLEESARCLLGDIRQHIEANKRTGRDRPILFIASCLGGIILTKALEIDDDYDRDERNPAPVRKATRGIVFLATPFRGTAFKNMPAPILTTWASLNDQTLTTLIDYTKKATSSVDELVQKFIGLQQQQDYHGFIFYEGRKTTLVRKVYLAWLFSNQMLLAGLVSLGSTWLLECFSPWQVILFLLWLSGFRSLQPHLVSITEHWKA